MQRGGKNVENVQIEYTVEYQCPMYGVLYYQNVMAAGIADAKTAIRRVHPDVIIRAVTLTSIGDEMDTQQNNHTS
jgi:hypothetical protein